MLVSGSVYIPTGCLGFLNHQRHYFLFGVGMACSGVNWTVSFGVVCNLPLSNWLLIVSHLPDGPKICSQLTHIPFWRALFFGPQKWDASGGTVNPKHLMGLVKLFFLFIGLCGGLRKVSRILIQECLWLMAYERIPPKFHQKLNGTWPTDPEESCDRAIRYSGFFGVRSGTVLLEISWKNNMGRISCPM